MGDPHSKYYKINIFKDPSGEDQTEARLSTRLLDDGTYASYMLEGTGAASTLEIKYGSLCEAVGGHHALLETVRAAMKDGNVEFKEEELLGGVYYGWTGESA
jgi:hypothetical protein